MQNIQRSKQERFLSHGKSIQYLMVYGGEVGLVPREKQSQRVGTENEWERTTSRRIESHLSFSSSASRQQAEGLQRTPPILEYHFR